MVQIIPVEQKEPGPRPLLSKPGYWVPIAAIIIAVIVLAIYDFNLTWIADRDVYKGAHATQLSDEEFKALKARKASELMANMKAGTPERAFARLPGVWRECEKRTALELMSKTEMESFYRTHHMPPFNEAIVHRRCFAKLSEGTPGLFGPTTPASSITSDERYLILQKLQRNCLNKAAERFGIMNGDIRNFCGCYATKQLASMQDDDVVNFRKTTQAPEDEQLHHEITEQCANP